MSQTQSNDTKATIDAIAGHYAEILRLIGEDPSREGLVKTPQRAAKALYYATSGYRSDLKTLVNDAIFTHDGSRMIIVKDIEFYSFCEHHILPFFGNVSVGYIPDGKIIGLSKVARIVDHFARRLQIHERITEQICDALMEQISAKGVIVACNAQHLCMKMRGVEKQDSSTTTVSYNGLFESNRELREEFFNSLKV